MKFRPVDPEKIGARWRKYRDFKIEVDASEKAMVKSASFSMPVAKGVIKRVAVGKKPIEAVFTAEQEEFLMTVARRKIDFERLAVLGPLTAQRWRFEDPACPWPITAELWRREDGAAADGGVDQGADRAGGRGIGGFMAYLAEVGAERDDSEQTQDALGHGLLRGQARRPAAKQARPRPRPDASAGQRRRRTRSPRAGRAATRRGRSGGAKRRFSTHPRHAAAGMLLARRVRFARLSRTARRGINRGGRGVDHGPKRRTCVMSLPAATKRFEAPQPRPE